MAYFDYAATSPLRPEVLESMLPHLQNSWGNPSSPHAKGREARKAIDDSRQIVADVFGVKTSEVIFTSSGSESNSLALFGTAESFEKKHGKPGKIVSSRIEHDCSISAFDKLKERGWQISMIDNDEDGLIDLASLHTLLTDDTALVSIQWANNEVGTIQPLEEIQTICAEHGVPYHCDAVQAIGQLSLPSISPDLMTIAAHKFGGPKGVAVLIAKEHVSLSPQILGGGQEHGLRSGTENTPAIAGLGTALRLAVDEQTDESVRLTALRDKMISQLESMGAMLNGARQNRLPNNINVRFAGVDAESLVIKLDLAGFSISTGSACATGSTDPSHVLLSMGRDKVSAKENVRITLGYDTTPEGCDALIEAMQAAIQ